MDWPEGFIAVLKKADNLRDLSILGLNPEDDGILGCSLEYVEEYRLETITFYRIGLLLDNECMMTFFSEAGVHDEEIEDYLAEEAVDVDDFDQMTELPEDEELPF
jgi:hypothetical protein